MRLHLVLFRLEMMKSTICIKLVLHLILVMLIVSLNITNTESHVVSPTSPILETNTSILEINDASEDTKRRDDTRRIDPLTNFEKYGGGYDITNKHYWSSTIFTGVYGYVIGVLWLICGLAYGGFLLAPALCRKASRKLANSSPCYKQCCCWPILLIAFFTILAIVASGLVLGGNARFHSQAKTVVNIVMDTANEASKTIFNTTGAMEGVRISLEATNEDSGLLLTSTSDKLMVQAVNIQKQAEKNRRLIDRGLKILYVIITLTISLNLIGLIAMPVCALLRLNQALHWLIILCWLLTVVCWLFFGMYFFLEKFSGDTCIALENFQKNPNNNSLVSILPCNELLSAKPALFYVSAGIYSLVNEVNRNISLMNSSYPNLVSVCNPFSAPPEYQYQPENCPANTIPIGDIPNVLKVFTCSGTRNGTCEDGLISTEDFKTVKAYSSSIQILLNAYPGMESLIECQTVKDAFDEILIRHCKPLKRYAHMVWAAMLFLSAIMVLLILTWTLKANHEQIYHLPNGFVKKPHSAASNVLELGIANCH